MVLHSFTICILLKQITKVHCIIKKKKRRNLLDWQVFCAKALQKHKCISTIQNKDSDYSLHDRFDNVSGRTSYCHTNIDFIPVLFTHYNQARMRACMCVCVCAAELKLLTRLKPVMAVCRTHRFKIKKRFNNSYRCNNFCTEAAWQINCILSAASRALSC